MAAPVKREHSRSERRPSQPARHTAQAICMSRAKCYAFSPQKTTAQNPTISFNCKPCCIPSRVAGTGPSLNCTVTYLIFYSIWPYLRFLPG